jgi:hypothetical protein
LHEEAIGSNCALLIFLRDDILTFRTFQKICDLVSNESRTKRTTNLVNKVIITCKMAVSFFCWHGLRRLVGAVLFEF